MYYAPNDIMRKKMIIDGGLSEEDQHKVDLVKAMGQRFWDLVDSGGQSRELSLAKTRIEEAVMWAVKHITR